MSVTGGNPDTIAAGSQGLSSAVRAVGATAKSIASSGGSAGGAAGDGRISASLGRFTAAWSQTTADLETQLQAAALLAENGAADLAVAGGRQPR